MNSKSGGLKVIIVCVSRLKMTERQEIEGWDACTEANRAARRRTGGIPWSDLSLIACAASEQLVSDCCGQSAVHAPLDLSDWVPDGLVLSLHFSLGDAAHALVPRAPRQTAMGRAAVGHLLAARAQDEAALRVLDGGAAGQTAHAQGDRLSGQLRVGQQRQQLGAAAGRGRGKLPVQTAARRTGVQWEASAARVVSLQRNAALRAPVAPERRHGDDVGGGGAGRG